jgi:hypothetical protein
MGLTPEPDSRGPSPATHEFFLFEIANAFVDGRACLREAEAASLRRRQAKPGQDENKDGRDDEC